MVLAHRPEEPRAKGVLQGDRLHIHVGERGERARLEVPRRADVDETPAGGKAPALGFFVPRHRDEHRGEPSPEPGHQPLHSRPLFVGDHPLVGPRTDGRVLHVDKQPAAGVHRLRQEIGIGDDVEIGPGHGERKAEEDACPLQLDHLFLQPLVDSPAPPLVGFRLVAFDAEDRNDVVQAGQPGDQVRGEEETVGDEEEDDVGEVPCDVDDFRAGQGLAAGDDEKGNTQLVRLRNDAPHPLHGKLVLRIAPNCLRVATLAPEVALVGDAEDGDRRDVQSFACHARPPARRGPLPENRPREEQRLARVPQADADELREEETDALVELRGRRRFSCHGTDYLLCPGWGSPRSIAHAGPPIQLKHRRTAKVSPFPGGEGAML